jgi:hypothetical protein
MSPSGLKKLANAINTSDPNDPNNPFRAPLDHDRIAKLLGASSYEPLQGDGMQQYMAGKHGKEADDADQLLKTKPQGVCPNCSSFDNISLCHPIQLTRVALNTQEFDGSGPVIAAVYLDKGADPYDTVPAPFKFWCDNCNRGFDVPEFMK